MNAEKSDISDEDLQKLQKYFDEFPIKMLESLKETISTMIKDETNLQLSELVQFQEDKDNGLH